jgi:hypothetical protein
LGSGGWGVDGNFNGLLSDGSFMVGFIGIGNPAGTGLTLFRRVAFAEKHA